MGRISNLAMLQFLRYVASHPRVDLMIWYEEKSSSIIHTWECVWTCHSISYLRPMISTYNMIILIINMYMYIFFFLKTWCIFCPLPCLIAGGQKEQIIPGYGIGWSCKKVHVSRDFSEKPKVTKHLTVGTQMIVIWWPWRDENLLCLSTVWNSDVFPCMSFVWLWTVKSVEAMRSWVLESQLQGMNPLESWSNWIQTVDGTWHIIVMCFIRLGHFDGGLWSILIQSPELSPFTHAGGMVFECCLFSYKLVHKSVNCRYTHHKSIHQHSCNVLVIY